MGKPTVNDLNKLSQAANDTATRITNLAAAVASALGNDPTMPLRDSDLVVVREEWEEIAGDLIPRTLHLTGDVFRRAQDPDFRFGPFATAIGRMPLNGIEAPLKLERVVSQDAIFNLVGRHVAFACLHRDALGWILFQPQGVFACKNAPAGARLIGLTLDMATDNVFVVFEAPSLPPVLIGVPVPRIDLGYTNGAVGLSEADPDETTTVDPSATADTTDPNG